MEGPAHVEGDRFDNGFVTTHFTRDAANHTAYLARGIRGIPNFPDPTNPTAWFMTYEVVHGRTWHTMEYSHTPAPMRALLTRDASGLVAPHLLPASSAGRGR